MKLPSQIKIRPVKTEHTFAVPKQSTAGRLLFEVDGTEYTEAQFVEHYRPADAKAKAFCELFELEFPSRGKGDE